jgi:hypothetical protein
MKRNMRTILIVVGLAVLSLMIMDFNSRMADMSRLRNQREQVAVEATQIFATHVSLTQQIAYATSEAAVLDRAYGQERMIQPGDVLIVPLSPGESTPVPTPTPSAPPVIYQNWQYWYALFFEKMP